MTVDDALNMISIADVLMSPDGGSVFFSESELDWDENKRAKRYYMIPAGGGEAIQFIGDAGGESFQFSPDGKYLSFLRPVDDPVDDNAQVFWMRTAGGEATKLTDHENGVESYKWSRDGRGIVFTANQARSEERQKEHDKGADAYYVREGPHGREEGSWRNLWTFDLSSMDETRLTDKELVITDFDVSPDGNRVVFAAARQRLSNYSYLSELYLVNTLEKKVVRLTNNNAGENNVLWAPDGKTIAYHAPSDQDEDLTNGFVWVMNPDTREKRKLEGQNQGGISSLTWAADSKSLLFNEARRTNSNLHRIDSFSPIF